MNVLQVCLFGNFRVKFEESNADIRMTRTVQGLFAYLLLYRHRTHSRDILSTLFWGDQDQDRARGSLNTTLWRLRSILESGDVPKGSYLLSDQSGDVGFNSASPLWLDVDIFERQVEQTICKPVDTVDLDEIDRLENALTLYTGELLDEFYDDWAIRARERMRALYLNSLAFLMKTYHHRRLFEQGLDKGRQILEIDPLREEIHREMMRHYLANGQRSLAVRQYEICKHTLQTELGIEPMEETQELFQKIKGANPPAAPSPSQDTLKEALIQLRQAAVSIGEMQENLWQALNAFEGLIKVERKSD